MTKACDWELLCKRTDNIQEQSRKILNATSTYRAESKNQSYQNQKQRGKHQQSHSSQSTGNQRLHSESRSH